MDSFRRGASGRFNARKGKSLSTGTPVLTELPMPPNASGEPAAAHVPGAMEMDHVYGLPPDLRGPTHAGDVDTEYHGQHGKHIILAEDIRPVASRESSLAPPTPPPHAKRQFSFSNVFNRHKHETPPPASENIAHEYHHRPLSRLGLGSRQGSKEHSGIPGLKTATEEERLGLVKGDSANNVLSLPDYTENSDEDDWQLEGKPSASHPTTTRGHVPLIREEEREKESDEERPRVPDKNTPRLGQGEDGRRY